MVGEKTALTKREAALPARRNKRLVHAFKTFKGKPETEFSLYAISTDPQEVARVIRENAGPQGLTEFDLDRIKVPTGGRTTWEIAGIGGEAEDIKMFEGIIVYFKDGRRWWKVPFDPSGGGMPPDCFAEADANGDMAGHGDPGGPCEKCPHSQWATAPKGGRGQACRACRVLFVIRPDETMPTVIPLPPTSIQPCRAFFLRLGSKSIPYYGVVAKFGLRKAQSKGGGVEFAQVVMGVAGILDPDIQIPMIEAYQNSVIPQLKRLRVSDQDFDAARDVDAVIQERDGTLPPEEDDEAEAEEPEGDGLEDIGNPPPDDNE